MTNDPIVIIKNIIGLRRAAFFTHRISSPTVPCPPTLARSYLGSIHFHTDPGATTTLTSRGRKSTPNQLKAAKPCSNCRRSSTDQEASKIWWIITKKSIPSAIPPQKVKPTSQENATLEPPDTKSPAAVKAMPTPPMISALLAPGTSESSVEATVEGMESARVLI